MTARIPGDVVLVSIYLGSLGICLTLPVLDMPMRVDVPRGGAA